MLDHTEVLRIAALARLELTPQEVDRMTRDLSQILEHVERLQRVQDRVPEPEAEEGTPRREDAVVPSRVTEELMQSAPERDGALVVVPRVVE